MVKESTACHERCCEGLLAGAGGSLVDPVGRTIGQKFQAARVARWESEGWSNGMAFVERLRLDGCSRGGGNGSEYKRNH